LAIEESTPKFKWEISTLPRMKSLRICKIKGFRRDQNFLKKENRNPSGPGVCLF
jgi:hypothetical protein